MCRLLGYVDVNGGSAEAWFLHSNRSLLAQSDHVPDQLQDDGWGVAWFPSGSDAPAVRKGVRGAFREEERGAFTQAARDARGPVVVGHLRHASNPLNLPHTELWALENSQPFSFRGSVFAHNGAIYQPTETRTKLGALDQQVRGVNDSEVLFWLLTRWTQELGDPLEAYVRTVQDLWQVWELHGRPASGPYGGLNVLWTPSPHELWAFCHWRGDHGSGLFATSQPYYEMSYRRAGDAVIVGSEPFDDEAAWKPIPNSTYLHLEKSDGHVSILSGAIPLEVARLKT